VFAELDNDVLCDNSSSAYNATLAVALISFNNLKKRIAWIMPRSFNGRGTKLIQ